MLARSLADVLGKLPTDRVSDFGFAQFSHGYPVDALANVAKEFIDRHLEASGKDGFLRLTHLRAAHKFFPVVKAIMFDSDRLDFLSSLAEVELEPYPMTFVGSHINMYGAGHPPIAPHSDGPAFVELVPLAISDDCQGGSTVVNTSGPFKAALGDTGSANQKTIEIEQRVGMSVLMQGRSIVHHVSPIVAGHRVTLVLPMQSKKEPWKDDNTLFRLLLDDDLADVAGEWCEEAARRAALYKMTQVS